MSAEASLRVLFIASGYPSHLQPYAGVFHETQARTLVSVGVAVTVIVPTPFVPSWVSQLRLPHRFRRFSIRSVMPPRYMRGSIEIICPKYLALPRADYWLPNSRLILPRVLAALAGVGTFDVFHGHGAYPHGWLAVQLGRRANRPSVLTLHGSDVNVSPDVNMLSRRRFVRSVQGADRVIAVSSALAERTAGLAQRKPDVMPIGIDLARFSSDDPAGPEASHAIRQAWLSGHKNGFVVLYVGNYTRSKGLEDLLAVLASKRHAGVHGVFVGDGPLRGAIASHANATDLGVLPNDRIPTIMRAADLLALPSHREGTPTVLIEAGAIGLPVVASSVGGVPELLAGSRGYLIKPGDRNALEAAIRHVLAYPSEARIRAEHLRRYVLEHYEAGANARVLRSVYTSALASRTTRELKNL